MALSYVYIGSTTEPSFFFTDNELVSCSANMGIDLLGNELTIDTFEFSVRFDDSDGDLRGLDYATPIWYYDGPDFVGKFYFKNIVRTGDTLYEINAVSVIGLLEYEKFYGRYYTNMTAYKAIEEVFKSDGIKRLVYSNRLTVKGSSESPAENVAFSKDYMIPEYVASETLTDIVVCFRVNSAPADSEQVIWKVDLTNCPVAYNGATTSITYTAKITVYGGYIMVYCYGSNTSHSVIAYKGYISNYFHIVRIKPKLGIVSIDGAETSFTSINVYLNLPMFGVLGYCYSGGTELPITTQANFTLAYIGFAESGSSTYHYYAFYKDYFSSDAYIAHSISVSYQNAIGGCAKLPKDSYEVESFSWYSYTYGNPQIITQSDINSAPMAALFDSIIWQDGIEDLTFSGWLASGSKREALHQILFALNLNLQKDENGNFIIGALPTEIAGTVDYSTDIYNSGSVEEVKKPLKLEVTEHYYSVPNDEGVTVFDNTGVTAPSGYYVVELNNAPIYDSVFGDSGIAVIGYTANAAVVVGAGKITGRQQKVTKTVLTETIGSRPDGDTISVRDVTLVTMLNSSAIMNKMRAFYASDVYKIKNAIVGNGRKIGRLYSLLTPFFEEATGYLTSARVLASSVTKYDCEFVSNYEPVSPGGVFQHAVLLTGAGTWELPEGVTDIHVVLIGGGAGGESGLAGEDGNRCPNFNTPTQAKGGDYGANGTAGKVYEVSISSPQSSYAYDCGSGGAGGAICTSKTTKNAGASGNYTTFGSYSSENGSVLENGYTDLITGKTYAKVMPTWTSGSGKGGDGGSWKLGNYSNCKKIESGDAYNFLEKKWYGGGYEAGKDYLIRWLNGNGESLSKVPGSAGGGAIGESGKSALYYDSAIRANRVTYTGADGGNATFVPPKPTEYNQSYYGYGGMGGAGGGGGGAGGGTTEEYQGAVTTYAPGSGGYGGRGGDGGDGCIIIYY